jgi:RimJ/RimL family protein N-acetyltransferase
VSAPELSGERVRLRGWREADLDPYIALLADPDVSYWLGGVDAGAVREHFALMARILDERGWGSWAVEDRSGELIGAVGLGSVPVQSGLPFAPAIEATWRLKRSVWGQGLATEAMGLALDHVAALPELTALPLVSFTAEGNLRSQGVMRKLGFEHDRSGDFGHPALSADHPLRRHLLFRRPWPERHAYCTAELPDHLASALPDDLINLRAPAGAAEDGDTMID